VLVLSAAERRGALVVLLLLAIGAGYDLWRALRPRALAVGAPARPATSPVPDVSAGRAATGGGSLSAARPAPVDLNRADALELDRLPGIGPVLAGRIVEHRERHGPFRRVEELRAVRGVGPRLLERLRPRVEVRPPADSARESTLPRAPP
jgi:competence protein ComEA